MKIGILCLLYDKYSKFLVYKEKEKKIEDMVTLCPCNLIKIDPLICAVEHCTGARQIIRQTLF